MKADKEILEKIDGRSGMTVPEGYFHDFAARMAASLPETSYEKSESVRLKPAPLSRWHRVRPYVYLAAMFAGVWCMLKLFTMLSSGEAPLEPSAVLADALENDRFVDHYIVDDIDTRDIFDQMYSEGMNLEDLDMYYYDETMAEYDGTEAGEAPEDTVAE